MTIQIAAINEEEIDKLVEIGQTTFYEAFGPPINKEEDIFSYIKERFSKERILKELQHPDSEFFFAKRKDQIVGYLKINLATAQTEKVDGKSLEIERIYVISKFQRQNIGKFLLDFGVQQAKKKKMDFVWLGVWEKNSNAIRFYTKNGFKKFAEHQYILGTDVQNDIMMKFDLEY